MYLVYGTSHYFVPIKTVEQKVDALCNIDAISKRAIVYCNSEEIVAITFSDLRERGIIVVAIDACTSQVDIVDLLTFCLSILLVQ